jgi:hypothetical protein
MLTLLCEDRLSFASRVDMEARYRFLPAMEVVLKQEKLGMVANERARKILVS